VSLLARGPGRIKERLQEAYIGQVMHAPVQGHGIPASIGDRIAAIHTRMTCVPAVYDGQGTIAATVAVMSEEQASDIVADLEEIEYDLRSAREHPEEWA
jgi:hypothetical protein